MRDRIPDPRQNDLLLTAWAAGFMDGEGTITIERGTDRYGKPQHHLRVEASQTGGSQPECLTLLCQLFGGRVQITKFYEQEPHRAPSWRWIAYARQADQVLEAMLPFLTVKREQARLAIEYRRRNIGNRDPRLSDEYMMRLRGLRQQQRTVKEKPPRVLRGRQRKLTDAQAAEISTRYAAGGVSYSQLAREYDVSITLICQIVRGISYYPRTASPSPGV